MKKLSFLFLFIFLSAAAFSQTYYSYTATKSGLWNDMSVWSISPRTDGIAKTKVLLPAGYTINVDNNVNNFGLGNVEITIAGTLNILANTTINLTSASYVALQGAGKITGTNNTQKIVIGTVTKYDGSKDFTKTGASAANATTGISPNGFSTLALLPVKWESFTAEKTGNSIQLKWTTAAETSNAYFNVEKSNDGAVWNSIGNVNAAGNTQTSTTYQYTDYSSNNNMVYYRIRQVDMDGRSSLSAVKTVNTQKTSVSKIYTSGKNLYIEPSGDITSAIDVVVMYTDGRLLFKQQYNSSSKININLSGVVRASNIVAVNISNKNGVTQSAKVFL